MKTNKNLNNNWLFRKNMNQFKKMHNISFSLYMKNIKEFSVLKINRFMN